MFVLPSSYHSFWTVVLEKTLESPLDCKEIKPVNPKGNQSWIFIGRTDAEAPILWPPDVKNWLIWKDPDAGKDRRREEKGTTEDDGWMASLTRWTWVWVGSRSWWWQGSLACCSLWGCKELDTIEWLNWTELSCHMSLNSSRTEVTTNTVESKGSSNQRVITIRCCSFHLSSQLPCVWFHPSSGCCLAETRLLPPLSVTPVESSYFCSP